MYTFYFLVINFQSRSSSLLLTNFMFLQIYRYTIFTSSFSESARNSPIPNTSFHFNHIFSCPQLPHLLSLSLPFRDLLRELNCERCKDHRKFVHNVHLLINLKVVKVRNKKCLLPFHLDSIP